MAKWLRAHGQLGMDPACGTAVFLIGVMGYLEEKDSRTGTSALSGGDETYDKRCGAIASSRRLSSLVGYF